MAKEQEEMEIAKEGEAVRPRPEKEEVRVAPKCMSEGLQGTCRLGLIRKELLFVIIEYPTVP